MDENRFIAHVYSLLYKCDDVAIGMNTHFKNIQGWNLVLAVSFVEMVQEEYQVELSESDLLQSETIAELYACIHARCKKL